MMTASTTTRDGSAASSRNVQTHPGLARRIEIVNDGVDDEHLDEFEGIPTTTVACAFRSCERSVMRDRLLAAIPVALAAGLLSDDEVSRLLEELRG